MITSVFSMCTVLYFYMQLLPKVGGDKLLQQWQQNSYFEFRSYLVVAVLFYLKACRLTVPSSPHLQNVGCQCIYCNACKSLDTRLHVSTLSCHLQAIEIHRIKITIATYFFGVD